MREAKLIVPKKWTDEYGEWETDLGPILEKLTLAYGGVTVTAGQGIWKAPDGSIVNEPVHILTVAIPVRLGRTEALWGAARYVGEAFKQEEVYLRTPNGEVHLLKRETDYN